MEIASLRSQRHPVPVIAVDCHCEERSDVAISKLKHLDRCGGQTISGIVIGPTSTKPGDGAFSDFLQRPEQRASEQVT